MPIFKQTTEITNIDDLLSSVERDIEEVYFGDKNVFTVWDTYDGALPAQYSANGAVLADYRVYGAAGGVGDATAQLFDPNATDTNNGYIAGNFLGYDNEILNPRNPSEWAISEYISCSPKSVYVLKTIGNNTYPSICWYDDNYNFLSGTQYNLSATLTVTSPTNAAYVRFSIYRPNIPSNSLTLFPAPASYTPYGYEVDMNVSDGATSTTTPIYIGDTPLGEDEYVSFKEQKVYRRTENLLNVDRIESRTFTTNTQYYLYGANADAKTLQIDKIVSASITKNYVEVYSLSGVGIGYVVDVKPNTTYTISYNLNISVPGNKSSAAINTISNNNVFGTFVAIYGNANKYTITTLQNTKYLFIVFRIVNVNAIYTNIVLTEGSTAPSTYIPYLQPTDPPVPLPALPTVDGTNIVDYAGQSAAPSRFYAKYRKEGFN